MSSVRAAEAVLPPSPRIARLLPLFLSLAGLPLAGILVWRAFPSADLFIRSPSGVKEAYLGIDFVNMWVGAKLALMGNLAPLFDPEAYQKVLKAWFGPDFPFFSWSYPPHMLLFILPLGALPYLAALAVWTSTTIAAFLVVAMPSWRASVRGPWFFGLLFAPSTIVNASAGQNGCLTAALLVGGMRLVPARPILAGVFFGLLTMKPHLGLVVPFVLVAMRAWRAIASAAAIGIALVAVSLAAFGPEAWQGFLTVTLPYQSTLVEAESYARLMVSIFRTARVFGLAESAALIVHLICAVGAVGAAMAVARLRPDPSLCILATVAATLLVMPYGFDYDFPALTAAVALYLARHEAPGPLTFAVLALAWIAAPFTVILNAGGLPVTPLLFAALLALSFWGSRRSQ